MKHTGESATPMVLPLGVVKMYLVGWGRAATR